MGSKSLLGISSLVLGLICVLQIATFTVPMSVLTQTTNQLSNNPQKIELKLRPLNQSDFEILVTSVAKQMKLASVQLICFKTPSGTQACRNVNEPTSNIPPTSADLEKVFKDGFVAQLNELEAKYNWPKSIPLGSSIDITLVIESAKPIGDTTFRSFTGEITAFPVRVADDVSATLHAAPTLATISKPKNERLQLTRMANAQWIWNITPLKPGTLILTLDINSHVRMDSKEKIIQFEPIRREIPIDVTIWQNIKIYADEIEPVWKVGSMILTGLAGILVFLGWRRKKNHEIAT